MRLPATCVRQTATAAAFAVLLAAVVHGAEGVSQPEMRAVFIYNFAKFTEWPGNATTPLTLCVLDDKPVETALGELVATSTINGRPVTVSRGVAAAELRNCHIVYVGDTGVERAAAVIDALKGSPILTVSNGDEFVRKGGVVGLFIEQGRMRFTINPDAAQRAGVRLSSRLLQLAKILKDDRHDR